MRPPALYFRNAPRDTADLQVIAEHARAGWREGGADIGKDVDGPRQQQQRRPVVIADALPEERAGDTSPATSDELTLLTALRDGDEAAFETLVNAHYPAMLRVALMYVRNRSVAEEVVQETWLAVLRGWRASRAARRCETWMFRILANRARTRGVREGRACRSRRSPPEAEGDEPAVEPERFQRRDAQWPRPLGRAPARWGELPEERLLALETRERRAASRRSTRCRLRSARSIAAA